MLAQAKRRLQYVTPGDTVYVVHAPPLAKPKPAAAAKAGTTTPWYSQLWDTLSDPTVTGKPAVPKQDPTSDPSVKSSGKSASAPTRTP